MDEGDNQFDDGTGGRGQRSYSFVAWKQYYDL